MLFSYPRNPFNLPCMGKNTDEFEASAQAVAHEADRIYREMLQPLGGKKAHFTIRFSLPIPTKLQLIGGEPDSIFVRGSVDITVWLVRDGTKTYLSTSRFPDDEAGRFGERVEHDE